MDAVRAGFGDRRPVGKAPRATLRPRSKLAALNRRLGRMSILSVTALFLVVTEAAAVSMHLLLDAAGLHDFDFDTLRAVAIVTVLVATPVILYAQSVIRELLGSRRALRMMTDRLALALHNAEQANEAKSAFLASMSHELRTPLNAIIGFSDIIANQRLGPAGDARCREYARDINASGTHLLEIINDILDLAKIEAGQPVLGEDRPVDLVTVLHAACVMVAPQASAGEVAIACRAPEVGTEVMAAERTLRQILVNILSNAVKFTPPGGAVTLEASLREDGALAIVVADTGIGMTAGEIEVALTPFGRVDSPLARRYDGTGLGLPLAKSLLELQGGRLRIGSEPGEGTTVELLFPPARVGIGRRGAVAP